MGSSVLTYRIDVLADGKKLGSFTYRANVGIDELVDNIRKIPRTAITIIAEKQAGTLSPPIRLRHGFGLLRGTYA